MNADPKFHSGGADAPRDLAVPLFLGVLLWVAGTTLIFALEHTVTVGSILLPAALGYALLFILSRGLDPFYARVVLTAFFAKLAAAGLLLALMIRQGAGDTLLIYDRYGKSLAGSENWSGLLGKTSPMVSTNFIIALSAACDKLLGPSLIVPAVLFAMAGFVGQILFFRAFSKIYPSANLKLAGIILFLFPSIVFWTATLGKDGPMLLGLGIIVYGVAILHCESTLLKGWMVIIGGATLSALVRPHFAAIAVISVGIGQLFGVSKSGWRSIERKAAAVPIIAVLLGASLYGLAVKTGASSFESLSEHTDKMYASNMKAGSAYGGSDSPVQRLLIAPTLIVRPFPWESATSAALVTSLESAALGAVFLFSLPKLLSMLWRRKREPFVTTSAVFVALALLALAETVSNFGLLARQRVMMLPFLLLLMVLAWSKESTPSRAR